MKSLYKSIDLGILSLTHIINYLTLVAGSCDALSFF